jgi:hypothetical protein
MAASLEQLNYGDVIYLSGRASDMDDSPTLGLLHGDAIQSKIGFARPSPGAGLGRDFEDCLFRVLPSLKYESISTRRELERRPSFSGNMEEQEMIRAGEDVENEMNRSLLQKYDSGVQVSVLYGQTIQLLHVSSNSFLRSNPNTAEMEKDCLRLSLDSGSECVLATMPPPALAPG